MKSVKMVDCPNGCGRRTLEKDIRKYARKKMCEYCYQSAVSHSTASRLTPWQDYRSAQYLYDGGPPESQLIAIIEEELDLH